MVLQVLMMETRAWVWIADSGQQYIERSLHVIKSQPKAIQNLLVAEVLC